MTKIHRGDLEIEDGGTLTLHNAELEVYGTLTIRGEVQMEGGSRLTLKSEGQPATLQIYGGSVIGDSASSIIGADAIDLQSGNLQLTDGIIIAGRIIARDSEVNLTRIQAESSGTTTRSYPGTAIVHLEGGSTFTATDSQLPFTYYASTDSYARLLNVSVDALAFSGPGPKEVAQRLYVTVLDADGQPIPNATVVSQSIPTAAADDTATTDQNGVAYLEHLVLDAGDVPRPHDPHLVLVNGLPASTALAIRGDARITVTHPM